MPRYMQVTPTFNPMSYEERIKPLEQYKQEYDKQMDTLDEQGMLADAIGGLIDPNQDPELAQIYNNFSNTMNNVAGELLRTGKLGETRRGLRELRTAYANQLVPIQTAYNDRAQAAKEFREAKLKDQTLIGTDPLTHSLKDYMKGKNPNDKVVSGNTLYSMALADTKAASGREFRETAWRLDKNLGSQFFSRIQKEGWSQDEVVQALAGLAGSEDKQISEDATKLMNYLADAHNRIHTLAGIDELKDAANIKEADNYILEGLITGIGYKQSDDQKAYDPSFWTKAELDKLKLDKEKGELTEDSDALPYELVPLTEIQGDKNLGRIKSDLQFLSDMKADPQALIKEGGTATYVPMSGVYNEVLENTTQPNLSRLQRVAKRYGIDNIGLTIDNETGKVSINNTEFNNAIDKLSAMAHREANINIARYNTTKNDDLVNKINGRSITTRGLKKENNKGRAEKTDEALPEGGEFRLNPWMKDGEVYYEYVVRDPKKGGYITYRVDPESVDNRARGWVAAYKKYIAEREYDKAEVAMHNAMILAYGSAEAKAKVQSITDSKL